MSAFREEIREYFERWREVLLTGVKKTTKKEVEDNICGLSRQSIGDYQPVFLENHVPKGHVSNHPDGVKLQAYDGKEWVDVTSWLSYREMLFAVKACISYTYREHRNRERQEKTEEKLYQKQREESLKKERERSSPAETSLAQCAQCGKGCSDVGMEVTPCCASFICWDFCLYVEPKSCPFCKVPWNVVPKDPVTKESYIELLEEEDGQAASSEEVPS